jgi:hypothetical protein
MANKIYSFVETHEGFVKPGITDLLVQINLAVKRVPHARSFRVGKKRIIKDGILQDIDEEDNTDIDDSLNVDESRDLDNRMCGDKVLRVLRDYIVKENMTVK